MRKALILQTAEPVSAPAHDEANPFSSISLFDEEVSIRGLGAERLPASGRLVDGSEDGNPVLRVAGLTELTARHASRFRRQVGTLLNGHTVIEIDLSRTTCMDCAGLGALIAISNLTLDRSGVIRLINPNPHVQKLLDLMRAGEIFEIVRAL